MRRFPLVPLVLVCFVASCGGDSPSTAAPSSVAAPQPTYPNLVGGWIGTYTSNITAPNIPGASGSGGCAFSWIITTQNAGQFSGTWQLSGGFGIAPNCGSSGNVSGSITNAGAITGLSFGTNVAPAPALSCTPISASGYSGVATVTSINASATERWSCTTGSTTLIADAGRVIALTKR